MQPDTDKNVQPQVTSLVTTASEQSLGSSRFVCFSVWKSLVRGMASLIHVAKSFSNETKARKSKGWHQCSLLLPIEYSQAKVEIFKAVQEDVYEKELKCLTQGIKVHHQSLLVRLDLFIDKSGLIRVGGRIHKAILEDQEKHPLILLAGHHVTTLLI